MLGTAIADRLSINLNELRARAGISLNELSNRAAMGYSTISEIEGDGAHELRLTTALRLVHSLGASIDQLTERNYWNPGQIVHNSQHPLKERLPGFFSSCPAICRSSSLPRSVIPSPLGRRRLRSSERMRVALASGGT